MADFYPGYRVVHHVYIPGFTGIKKKKLKKKISRQVAAISIMGEKMKI